MRTDDIGEWQIEASAENCLGSHPEGVDAREPEKGVGE